MFVGVDWGSQQHAICVLDAAGRKVAVFTVTHSAAGLGELIARLGRLGDPAERPVAIERRDGRLVDRLLEAGHPVVPIPAHALKAWRRAHSLAGAKSDPGDAMLLADYLRCAQHRLRVLQPFSPQTRALRAVVRTREDLVDQRVAAGNQLRATLEAFWPGARVIFADLASPISLAFLTRYPTPEAAQRLGEQRLAAFLVKHGYCGRRSAAQLLERLRAAPPGSSAASRPRPAGMRSGRWSGPGGAEHRQQGSGALDRRPPRRAPRRARLHVPATVRKAQRGPGARRVGRLPPSLRRPQAIACLAGAAPVTRRSGKHTSVSFRWACNKRLRKAIGIFADNSRHASPWAAKVYADARARGLDHPHAIRVLAERGSGSSGAAGRTACPTNRPSTAPPNA
jgi:transposase